jgi:hypothetical protein
MVVDTNQPTETTPASEHHNIFGVDALAEAKGPLARMREAARQALSQRMTMEMSDLATRIRRMQDHAGG